MISDGLSFSPFGDESDDEVEGVGIAYVVGVLEWLVSLFFRSAVMSAF